MEAGSCLIILKRKLTFQKKMPWFLDSFLWNVQ
jgi:hypothetical protein